MVAKTAEGVLQSAALIAKDIANERILEETEKREASLKALLEQAKAISERAVPTIINNEGDRYIMALLIRLLETLVHGEPKTSIPSRHHA